MKGVSRKLLLEILETYKQDTISIKELEKELTSRKQNYIVYDFEAHMAKARKIDLAELEVFVKKLNNFLCCNNFDFSSQLSRKKFCMALFVYKKVTLQYENFTYNHFFHELMFEAAANGYATRNILSTFTLANFLRALEKINKTIENNIVVVKEEIERIEGLSGIDFEKMDAEKMLIVIGKIVDYISISF